MSLEIKTLRCDDVEVFPSGFRGQYHNKSKLTTEANLRTFSQISSNSQNHNQIFTDPYDSTMSIIYLKGYYFRIPTSKLIELLPVDENKNKVTSGYLFAFTHLADKDESKNIGKVLANASPNTLDQLYMLDEYITSNKDTTSNKPAERYNPDESKFCGLQFFYVPEKEIGIDLQKKMTSIRLSLYEKLNDINLDNPGAVEREEASHLDIPYLLIKITKDENGNTAIESTALKLDSCEIRSSGGQGGLNINQEFNCDLIKANRITCKDTNNILKLDSRFQAISKNGTNICDVILEGSSINIGPQTNSGITNVEVDIDVPFHVGGDITPGMVDNEKPTGAVTITSSGPKLTCIVGPSGGQINLPANLGDDANGIYALVQKQDQKQPRASGWLACEDEPIANTLVMRDKDGMVQAAAFIGDGSRLENIKISADNITITENMLPIPKDLEYGTFGSNLPYPSDKYDKYGTNGEDPVESSEGVAENDLTDEQKRKRVDRAVFAQEKLKIPKITVDKYGRVTDVSEFTTAYPLGYVKQVNRTGEAGGCDREYVILTGDFSIGSTTKYGKCATNEFISSGTIFSKNVTINPYTGQLKATKFVGDGSGLTNITANNITSGTLHIDRLPQNVKDVISYVDEQVLFDIGTAAKCVEQTNWTEVSNYNGDFSILTTTGDVDGVDPGKSQCRDTAFSRKVTINPYTGELKAAKFTGNGSNLSELNANNITSGTLSDDRLPDIVKDVEQKNWTDDFHNEHFSILVRDDLNDGIDPGNSATSGTAFSENVTINPFTGELKATKFTCTDQITANSFLATSDERLKENIQPFNYDRSIIDLEVKTFDFKEGAKNQIGCIAQDLQKIYPELVVTHDNGYLSINENKLVYLLLEEVKLLKAEIRELKGE